MARAALEDSLAQAEAAPLVMGSTAWLAAPGLLAAIRAGTDGGGLAIETKPPLGQFDVVPGGLVAGKSGVHRYSFDGSVGIVLSAKVATNAFEPVVVVLSPGGVRWDMSTSARTPDPGSGGPPTPGEVILPDDGQYLVLVSSRENVTKGRAVTTGEYRLTLLCDAPRKAPPPPVAAPSSRSGRFAAWESEPR